MPKSRFPVDSSSTRRRLLKVVGAGIAGAGTLVSLQGTGAFSTVQAPRESTLGIVDDPDALVGLSVADEISRKDRELLTPITNNTSQTLTFTVSLNECTQGTLEFASESGCTVSGSIAPGNTDEVYLTSDEKKDTTIPFTVAGEGGGFDATMERSTTVVGGNADSPITIEKIDQFKTEANNDEWTIKRLYVESDDYDIDRIELEVTEQGSGDTVSTRTIDNIDGKTYDKRGSGADPALTLVPDDSTYNVRNNVTYELTVRAYDVEGNADIKTVEEK